MQLRQITRKQHAGRGKLPRSGDGPCRSGSSRYHFLRQSSIGHGMTRVRLARQIRNSDCVLKSQRNPTQSRSACRSIAGLCIFLLGLFGSVSSSAASEPAPPATNGSSSASSSESGEAKTSTPVVSVTGTIAGDSALNRTPFANEESPSFVASFAPAPGTTPPTTNQVSPGPDANPPAANNLPADSASGLKDKEEEEWKLLPKGWNFHAQTTIIPDFQRRIRCPVLRSQQPGHRPRTRGNDYRRRFISARRYGRVPSFTRIC